MKKTEIFSFRTTEQNLNYLKLLAEFDDLSQSYILNKMIDAFRNRGCFTIEQINQMAKFDIGDKVVHKLFGEGTITDIAVGNSANLTIIFEDGKKVIKSSFVKLLK